MVIAADRGADNAIALGLGEAYLDAEAPGQVHFSQNGFQSAGRHDTAIGHEQAVGEPRWDLLHVMCDQHHRWRGRVGGQGPEDDDQLLTSGQVESRGGLVKE